jgi:3-dehydroquinate dehydratase
VIEIANDREAKIYNAGRQDALDSVQAIAAAEFDVNSECMGPRNEGQIVNWIARLGAKKALAERV